MNDPYLIQRCYLRRPNVKHSEIKGFDSVFALDYMGASEFEFGALPESLREITSILENYKIYPTSHKTVHGEGIFLFASEPDVVRIFDNLCKKKYHTKERTGIEEALRADKKNQFRTVLWWDIENNWFACISKDTAKLLQFALTRLRDRWKNEGKIP